MTRFLKIKIKTTLIIFLIIIALLITAFLPITSPIAQFFSPFKIEKLIGNKAPDFTANDLSGNSVSFSSFKNKPILLNFWATWCPYCREERPYLDSIYKEYKGRGLLIIAVSIDKSVGSVKRHLKKRPMDFIVLHDNNNDATEAYGVYSLPTSFLIARDGVIKHKFIGPNWTGSRKRFIEELVK